MLTHIQLAMVTHMLYETLSNSLWVVLIANQSLAEDTERESGQRSKVKVQNNVNVQRVAPIEYTTKLYVGLALS